MIETEYGIEEHPSIPGIKRLFNPDTGKRSDYFRDGIYRDAFGLLTPPPWAVRSIQGNVGKGPKLAFLQVARIADKFDPVDLADLLYVDLMSVVADVQADKLTTVIDVRRALLDRIDRVRAAYLADTT